MDDFLELAKYELEELLRSFEERLAATVLRVWRKRKAYFLANCMELEEFKMAVVFGHVDPTKQYDRKSTKWLTVDEMKEYVVEAVPSSDVMTKVINLVDAVADKLTGTTRKRLTTGSDKLKSLAKTKPLEEASVGKVMEEEDSFEIVEIAEKLHSLMTDHERSYVSLRKTGVSDVAIADKMRFSRWRIDKLKRSVNSKLKSLLEG